jgi:UDP-2-acetamido-3-amino-2,3-dideoxy-glucuronate N-acetyltransferase
VIHASAEVHTSQIGDGTSVWQYSVIMKGARIGRNCNINCHVFIEDDVIIGDNVTVKSGVQLWNGIYLEDDVFVGPNVTFTNDLFPRSKRYPKVFSNTIVRKGASIGANATILAEIIIGQYAMIGAGSVVTKSIPDNTIWFGNPAVFRGYACMCGHKLGTDFVCMECGRKYSLRKNVVYPND